MVALTQYEIMLETIQSLSRENTDLKTLLNKIILRHEIEDELLDEVYESISI